MFNLTGDERKAVLFLSGIILLGIALNFCIKVYPPVKKVAFVEETAAKIDINKASLEELLEARFLGRKLAQSIIEYRDANGPFESMDDLKSIKGIGDYRLSRLKELFFLP